MFARLLVSKKFGSKRCRCQGRRLRPASSCWFDPLGTRESGLARIYLADANIKLERPKRTIALNNFTQEQTAMKGEEHAVKNCFEPSRLGH